MEVLSRPETNNRVYLYLDEAQEYLSDSPIIRRLYEQGRKRGLCMITACQEVNQLERAGIDKMINSLTSIKFAGGVSASDATKLAKEMDTDAETIRSVPELTFAAWLKHHGTGTYKVTPGVLEEQATQDEEYISTLKHNMLAEYHYYPDDEWEQYEDSDAEEESGEVDYDTYWDDPAPDDEKPKKKPPRDDKDDDDIDPDAPQDLG